MIFFKNIVKSLDFLPIIAVVFFAVLAARTLLFQPGYFNMHDDLQMMRQLEMEKCFKDGQIPCRWVPDMGYGYGFPLFNFYPPLPYLVGELFRLFGFSFVNTVKITFALSFILSGLTMYFLGREFFGRWGGLVSSTFYIWAPYHSVDVYIRGAMNEAWALIWFPLILLFSFKLISEKKRVMVWFTSLALSWTGLLLSHNLMVMIFTPFFAFWCLMFWLRQRDIKKGFMLVFSGIFAFSLSAFFTLPAIFEQQFIHVDTLTQGYYEYIAHFATIGQLIFSRFWGYGPSVWGPNDGMSFQIGHLHWILSLILGVLVFLYLLRKKKVDNFFLVIAFGIFCGWFAAFMVHQNSTFIWKHIKILAFVQFPWRFLTIVILCFSFVTGSLVELLRPIEKFRVTLIGALAILLLILNWNYFLPQGGKMGALTDKQKFSGAAWDLQRTAGIFDYLPKTAKENPKAAPNSTAEVVSGKGEINNPSQGTNWVQFSVNLSTDSVIRIGVFQFPNWRATVDNHDGAIYIPTTEIWGRMYINIPKGRHIISLKFENTQLRTFSNFLSLVAWLSLLTIFIFRKKLLHGKID